MLRAPWWFLPPLAALAACKAAPETRHATPTGDPAAGRQAMRAAGCAACHVIPGIGWPRGRLGPALTGFAERTTIAGTLPNRPDLLADWLKDAPRLKPGTTMPAIPLTETQARDAAAYLYSLDAR